MRTESSWGAMERIAFTVWLAASAGACTGWHTVDVSPEQLIAEHHPTTIRVTRQDGSRMEVKAPSTAGDTIHGAVEGDTVSQAEIPFSDVARLEARQVSAGKTAALVVGILAVGAAVAGGVALASWDCCLGNWGQ